jgi:hypothetical protein
MGAIAYQVNQLEKRQDATEHAVDGLRDGFTRHEEQISGAGGLIKAMGTLGDKVDSLNRALYAFAGSFMIAAITIGVAIATHA